MIDSVSCFKTTTVAFLLPKLYDSRFIYIVPNSDEDKKGIDCSWIHKEERRFRKGKGIALACCKTHLLIILHETIFFISCGESFITCTNDRKCIPKS